MGFGKVVDVDEKIINLGGRRVKVGVRTFESGLQRVHAKFCDRTNKQEMLKTIMDLTHENNKLKEKLKDDKK